MANAGGQPPIQPPAVVLHQMPDFKASMVPNFFPPVEAWAQQVINVLQRLGVDFNHPQTELAVRRAILPKIPQEYYYLLPAQVGIQDTLLTLKGLGPKPPGPVLALQADFVIDDRPSMTFFKII